MKTIETGSSHPQLCDLIAQRIAASPDRRITFAEFMDLALYDPSYGYYATNQVNIGMRGDFFTAPHLGRDFGELLAEQFVDMWHQLDHPHPFTLVEMGAGQGLLVQDVLRYLHRHYADCFAALEYLIVEASPALVAEQRRSLQRFAESWGRLHWRQWHEIAPESVTGCFFSNELVDALPVHQVAIASGRLHEIYVTLADPTQLSPQSSSGCAFVETLGDLSTPRLQEYFTLSGVDFPSAAYAEGYRTEVNLVALDWLTTVAQRLRQGYLLTIDYGYLASRYYSPARHQGTLQCYYQHTHHNDPYLNVGRQDITTHVNFTALERQGLALGLTSLGLTPQGLFLMALGLGDRIAAISTLTPTAETSLQDILQRREALHLLANPMAMGNFGVLIQTKGLSDRQHQLKGLQMGALS